jgi:hypothetical protein
MDRLPLADLNKTIIVENIKAAKSLQGIPGVQWAVKDTGKTKTGKSKSRFQNGVYIWVPQPVGPRGGRTYKEKQVGVMTKPGSGHGTTRASSNPFEALMAPHPSLSEQTSREWTGRDGKLHWSLHGIDPDKLSEPRYRPFYVRNRSTKEMVPSEAKEFPQNAFEKAFRDPEYHSNPLEGDPSPPPYASIIAPKRAPQPRYNPFENWTEHKTDSGDKYFFNQNTRATSWNKPGSSFGRRRKRRSTRSRKRPRSRRRRRSASRKRRRSRKKCHSRVRGHKRRSRRVRSHNRRRKCKRRKRRLSFGYPVVSPADCVTRTFGTTDSIPGAQTPSCYSLNPMEWFTTATGSQV